jgi:signal transduction histidine kinase
VGLFYFLHFRSFSIHLLIIIFTVMPSLDQYTLVVVATSVTLLAAILLIYLESISKQIKGPKWWSLGSFMVSLGIIFFAYHSFFGKYIAFVVGGTGIILGVLLYKAGLRRYNNKQVNYQEMIIVTLTNFIQGSIFTLIYPSEEIRMIIYSIISVYTAFLLLVEFLSPESKSIKKISIVGILVASTYGITMVARIFYVFVINPEHAAAEILITKILFYIIILSQIALAFVFIILFNIKLSDELKDQLTNRDKFFSIISHDLNGPVRTMAEMLRIINNNELFNKDRQQKLLSELEKISNSTSHLLQNLLQWSKNQINSVKVSQRSFDLSEMIEQNIELIEQNANYKSIKINYQGESKIDCFADPMMIDTVLRNLLSNAVKFTPEKGVVGISLIRENGHAIIGIKDSGKGIKNEVLEKLNENQPLISSYGTNGEKGSGLGLLLCKDFVAKNNGEMKIISGKNQGTEIKIKLPVDLTI